MMHFRSVFLRALVFGMIWWTLTGGDPSAVLFGIPVVAMATAVSLWLRPPLPARFSARGLAAFAVFFLHQSVKGGLQVGLMALRPSPSLQPAILAVPLQLRDEAEQAFLAAVLSLMPGTLVVGLDSGMLQVHVLDERFPVREEIRQAEARVAGMFRRERR